MSRIADYIYDFCPLGLPFPDVGLSVDVGPYVALSILLPISVWAAGSLFCACLASVHISAPYAISDSTHELYTCLSRQMAGLLLKISRCWAYASQPAMILRYISLSWSFYLMMQCCPMSTFSIRTFFSADWSVVY